MNNLANEVFLNAGISGMQVLTLDWREAASSVASIFDGSAENWIPSIAEWAKTALQTMGFTNLSLNLLGHSYGAVISGELAERIGGVNTIIALDPANNHPLGDEYDTESILQTIPKTPGHFLQVNLVQMILSEQHTNHSW